MDDYMYIYTYISKNMNHLYYIYCNPHAVMHELSHCVTPKCGTSIACNTPEVEKHFYADFEANLGELPRRWCIICVGYTRMQRSHGGIICEARPTLERVLDSCSCTLLSVFRNSCNSRSATALSASAASASAVSTVTYSHVTKR